MEEKLKNLYKICKTYIESIDNNYDLKTINFNFDQIKKFFSEPEVLPNFMIRSDDYVVFSLNDDNKTYSVDKSKKQWPNNIHHKYSYQRLIDANFFHGDENNFDYYQYRNKKYHDDIKNEDY
jgi:hypothetical protein